MARERKSRPLTFEEISKTTGVPLNQVHKTFRSGYNKLIEGLEEKTDMSIFDVVLAVREYCGIAEEEAFRYLNDENKERIRLYAMKEYNISDVKEKDLTFDNLFA